MMASVQGPARGPCRYFTATSVAATFAARLKKVGLQFSSGVFRLT